MTEGGRQRTIQSVDRAAILIKAIADSRQPPTVVELAAACGLNRSTAWRLLATLDAHGLIERDPVSQRYSLGYAFLRIAAGRGARPARAAGAAGARASRKRDGRDHEPRGREAVPARLRRPGRPAADHGAELVRPRRAAARNLDRQGLPRVHDAGRAADGAARRGWSGSPRRRSPTARRSTRSSPKSAAPGTRRASASSRSRSSARRLPCSPSRAGRSRSSACGARSTGCRASASTRSASVRSPRLREIKDVLR